MHDIFISYSHKDAQIADAICHKFEEAGIRCWYAPRNIRPGDEWASAIIKALEECKAMILIFTDASNLSVQVHREVDAAVSSGKTIIPFKCSETEPSGSMRYYLSTLHWMDALTEPMDESINNLLQFTKRVIMDEETFEAMTSEQSAGTGAKSPAAGTPGTGKGGSSGSGSAGGSGGRGGLFIDRQKLIWILAAVCVVLAIVTAVALSSKNKNNSAADTASAQESRITESAGADSGEAEDASDNKTENSGSTDPSGSGEDAAAADSSEPAYSDSAAASADSGSEAGDAAENAASDSAATDSAASDSAAAGSESTAADSNSSGAAEGEGSDAAADDADSQEYEFSAGKSSPGADNYLYTVLSFAPEVRLDRYFGPEDSEIVIPEIIDGLPVTWIGEKCFQDHDYIEKVVLPETMETIAYRSFYGCSKLKDINIPSSLTRINGWAFAHCGFEQVELPDTLQYLDYGAFYSNEDLVTVVLPATVDTIGENTFRMCPKLVSVTMPAQNPSIDAKAFEPETNVTIIGIPGSYSEKYAKGMGLKFEAYQG